MSGPGCSGALGGDAGEGGGRRVWAPSVHVSCSRLILQLIKPNIPDGVSVGLLGAGPSPTTLAQIGRKDKWMAREGEALRTNWDV